MAHKIGKLTSKWNVNLLTIRRLFVGLQSLIRKLTYPKSSDKDKARREYILNFLLLGYISLSLTALFLVLASIFIGFERGEGAPVVVLIGIAAFFIFLYRMSRVGKSQVAAYLLISASVLPSLMDSLKWGVLLPQSLLMFALSIVMAGVLVGSRFAFVTTAFISISMIVLNYLQTEGILETNFFWETGTSVTIGDALVAVFTLGVIFLVSWLSNREIDKSLKRARLSEKRATSYSQELKTERDLLEFKVEERTSSLSKAHANLRTAFQNLRKAQYEKLLQANRMAQFGQLSAGLIHAIIQPITSISTNLEILAEQQAKPLREKTLKASDRLVRRALDGVAQARLLIDSARLQIRHQEERKMFDAGAEVGKAVQLLSYKSENSFVNLEKVVIGDPKIFGDTVKFNQLVTNLVTNAIDSYPPTNQKSKSRKILIKLSVANGNISLKVQDWGRGISKQDQKKVFATPFTTKEPDRGMGTGLVICKAITEQDFKGKITFVSKEGAGTTFSVEIPLRKNEKS